MPVLGAELPERRHLLAARSRLGRPSLDFGAIEPFAVETHFAIRVCRLERFLVAWIEFIRGYNICYPLKYLHVRNLWPWVGQPLLYAPPHCSVVISCERLTLPSIS